jgi:hypothetical protein
MAASFPFVWYLDETFGTMTPGNALLLATDHVCVGYQFSSKTTVVTVLKDQARKW